MKRIFTLAILAAAFALAGAGSAHAGLLDNLWGHGCGCGCGCAPEPTCGCQPKCEPTCGCETKCEPTCDPCCKKKLFHRPAKCDACDTCNTCCDKGPSLLDRLRACFHKDKGCCDGGCSSGTCGGTTVMPKAGENITTPPKKIPASGKEPPAKEEVRIETPPALAPAAPAITPTPVIVPQPAAPATAPTVEPDNLRNPF